MGRSVSFPSKIAIALAVSLGVVGLFASSAAAFDCSKKEQISRKLLFPKKGKTVGPGFHFVLQYDAEKYGVESVTLLRPKSAGSDAGQSTGDVGPDVDTGFTVHDLQAGRSVDITDAPEWHIAHYPSPATLDPGEWTAKLVWSANDSDKTWTDKFKLTIDRAKGPGPLPPVRSLVWNRANFNNAGKNACGKWVQDQDFTYQVPASHFQRSFLYHEVSISGQPNTQCGGSSGLCSGRSEPFSSYVIRKGELQSMLKGRKAKFVVPTSHPGHAVQVKAFDGYGHVSVPSTSFLPNKCVDKGGPGKVNWKAQQSCDTAGDSLPVSDEFEREEGCGCSTASDSPFLFGLFFAFLGVSVAFRRRK